MLMRIAQHACLLKLPCRFLAPFHSPSGSGKTTLLDVLAGRKTVGQLEGTVAFAGNKPTPQFLRRFTGYVEQFGGCCCPQWLFLLVCLVHAAQAHDCRCKAASPHPPTPTPSPSPSPPPFAFNADTLLDILTVEEMLMYTAELKRPISHSRERKQAAVEELIDLLALDGCRAVKIGK